MRDMERFTLRTAAAFVLLSGYPFVVVHAALLYPGVPAAVWVFAIIVSLPLVLIAGTLLLPPLGPYDPLSGPPR